MNERNYGKHILTEYLLGALPEAEAEKFDELGFTDENFADELRAAENDLIDAYIQGELAGAKLKKFDSYYLATPLRREKVRFAESFQTYAEENRALAKANAASEKSRSAETFFGRQSSLDIFRSKFSALRWSFGAVLLLLIIAAGFGLFDSLTKRNAEIARQESSTDAEPPTPRQIDAPQPENANADSEIAARVGNVSPPESDKKQVKKVPSPARVKTPALEKSPESLKPSIASFILAPSLRGGGQIKTVSIPRRATDAEIQLELEAADYATYGVALSDESGSGTLWRKNNIKAVGAGENKRLIIRFPAELLKSKIYLLTVSGTNPNGEAEIAGDYPFRVVIK